MCLATVYVGNQTYKTSVIYKFVPAALLAKARKLSRLLSQCTAGAPKKIYRTAKKRGGSKQCIYMHIFKENDVHFS